MKLPFIAFFLSLASMHMQGQGQLLITEVSADQGISDIMGGVLRLAGDPQFFRRNNQPGRLCAF